MKENIRTIYQVEEFNQREDATCAGDVWTTSFRTDREAAEKYYWESVERAKLENSRPADRRYRHSVELLETIVTDEELNDPEFDDFDQFAKRCTATKHYYGWED